MRAYVYILSSMKNGTLYTGVTTDLIRRVHEHRSGQVNGFTQNYKVRRLVYFEIHEDVREAISREKQIKKWNRSWKIRLIKRSNPEWTDLYPEIVGERPF